MLDAQYVISISRRRLHSRSTVKYRRYVAKGLIRLIPADQVSLLYVCRNSFEELVLKTGSSGELFGAGMLHARRAIVLCTAVTYKSIIDLSGV